MSSDQSKTLKSGGSFSDKKDVDVLVQKLRLQAHPDGGFFRETWRGKKTVLGQSDGKIHDVGSSIYLLLRNCDTSKWHRTTVEELFLWHAGGVLKVHTINLKGELRTRFLGDMLKHPDCQYEAYMEPNVWMALEPTQDSPYVLIAVAATPGFESESHEEGKKTEMKGQFPQHADIIDRLCG